MQLQQCRRWQRSKRKKKSNSIVLLNYNVSGVVLLKALFFWKNVEEEECLRRKSIKKRLNELFLGSNLYAALSAHTNEFSYKIFGGQIKSKHPVCSSRRCSFCWSHYCYYRRLCSCCFWRCLISIKQSLSSRCPRRWTRGCRLLVVVYL